MRFGNQQADYLRDVPEAVQQIVGTRLRLLRGEWYVDTSAGMPWFGAVLGVRTRETIEPAVRAEVLAAPGVTGIRKFDTVLDDEGRVVSMSIEIDTVFGPAVVVVEGV